MAATVLGSHWSFAAAVALVIVWGVTGLALDFTGEWLLVMTVVTNIVMFLMLFILQNSQNRDAAAINAKLDELLRTQPEARGELIAAEEKDLEEIEEQKQRTRRSA